MSERIPRLNAEIVTEFPCCGHMVRIRPTNIETEVFPRVCPACSTPWLITRRRVALQGGMRTDRLVWDRVLDKPEMKDLAQRGYFSDPE
jgi:hypothetical protein